MKKLTIVYVNVCGMKNSILQKSDNFTSIKTMIADHPEIYFFLYILIVIV